MFADKTTDGLLWALLLFVLTRNIGRGEGGPRPIPGPKVTLQQGFYWYFLESPAARDQYFGWLKRQKNRVDHRKWLGTVGVDQALVVFHVRNNQTADWELPGLPTPAPKGVFTTIEDIEGAGASSTDPDTFSEWVGKMGGIAYEKLRELDYRMQQYINDLVWGPSK